jgi:hypothetical protein|tara:strand:- start:602 stop:1228 length:627 start_codon:yes stop_codon:yes gene_type:complete
MGKWDLKKRSSKKEWITIVAVALVWFAAGFILATNFTGEDCEVYGDIVTNDKNNTYYCVDYNGYDEDLVITESVEKAEYIRDVRDKCLDYDYYTTVECVVEEVSEIYYYYQRPYEDVITWDELYYYGADCKHWTQLYQEIFENMGYYTAYVEIDVDTETSHLFLTVGDYLGYCTVDQTFAQCYDYAVDDSVYGPAGEWEDDYYTEWEG